MHLDHVVVSKLACPTCESSVNFGASDTLVCTTCASTFAINDGIVDFLVDKTKRTKLEDIDYDAVGGISDAAIENIGRAWMTVFANAGIDLSGKSVLEVGTGTGALTLGLLKLSRASYVFATDISDMFLRKALSRAGAEPRLIAIRCDCNNVPVKEGVFDVIVGRSILHHLLDYEQVLSQCARILRKDGKAIFFEPILEGKIILALYGAMVVSLAERDNDLELGQRDRNLIKSIVRHITKASWYPQDRESLARLEDKFIFTLPGLRKIGLKIGFKSVEFLKDDRKLDSSYWSYFVDAMRMVGVQPAKLEKYRFLSAAYKETAGAFRELVQEPMGYFCFSR